MYKDNIIQSIIKDYASLDKKDAITFSQIPHLTMVTSFWFMRITGDNYARLEEKCSKNKTILQTKRTIEEIQMIICDHFLNEFSDEFDKYQLNIIDYIFRNFKAIELEWMKLSSSSCSYKIVDNSLNDIILANKRLYQNIKAFEEKYYYFLIDVDEKIIPSGILNIDIRTQQKRNFELFYKDPTLWTEFRSSLSPLITYINEMHKMITKLFCFNDDDFKEILSSENIKGKPTISKLLHDLRYPPSEAFNLEVALMFMFLDYKIPNLIYSCLIKKYESFFNNMYMSMRKEHIEIDDILFPLDSTDHEEAIEEYISEPPNVEHIKERLNFFKLKKLIALNKLYVSLSSIQLSSEYQNLRDAFYDILYYTRMQYIAYNPVLDNLPQYIMDVFEIKQKDLASIFNKNTATVSKWNSSNTLIENEKWFWLAATGYTEEYMNGETTIPRYGKSIYDDSDKYQLPSYLYMAHAELFLKRINQLKDYRIQVSKNSKKRKLNILSKKHMQEISKMAITLADCLAECRNYIDRLCEIERNKDFEAHINFKKPEQIAYSDKAIEKLWRYVNIFDMIFRGFPLRFKIGKDAPVKDEGSKDILTIIENTIFILLHIQHDYEEIMTKAPSHNKIIDEFNKDCSVALNNINILYNFFEEALKAE